jgi:hypothetical protein
VIKRLVWFVGGAVAGLAGAGFAKRKMREVATELAPAHVAKKAGERVRDAISEGRRAARLREAELKAALDGRGSTLADELDDGDTVLVDGHPVEPGQVIVLRQVDSDTHAGRRARSAQRHRRRGA